jgi:hypothetical protein
MGFQVDIIGQAIPAKGPLTSRVGVQELLSEDLEEDGLDSRCLTSANYDSRLTTNT